MTFERKRDSRKSMNLFKLHIHSKNHGIKDIKVSSYLRSVDFDGNVVALRRPLVGLGHFESSADQINAELALRKYTIHNLNNFFLQGNCRLKKCLTVHMRPRYSTRVAQSPSLRH